MNAIDACRGRDRGEIKVTLVNGKGGEVLLSVHDNGSGIPSEVKDHIWSPFFTTKDVGEGTGLGLWMVRRAVEVDHSGKVWFETGREGTTFFVSLPKKGVGYGRTEAGTKEKDPLH